MTARRPLWQTEQYTSEHFVESVGAVLFHLPSRKICVLHLLDRDQYVLANGRRSLGETRHDCAMREVLEETGYRCRLLPVTMLSRVTPVIETEPSVDIARTYAYCTEPFTMQIRQVSKTNVKVIWWYVGAVEEDQLIEDGRSMEADKNKVDVEFYSYEDVLEVLTFQTDKEMVKRAIELVAASYGEQLTLTFTKPRN